MSAKILHLPKRRAKANGKSRREPNSDPLEMTGNELVIFMLRDDGGGTAWVSERVKTVQEWNSVLEFVEKLRDGLRDLRDQAAVD